MGTATLTTSSCIAAFQDSGYQVTDQTSESQVTSVHSHAVNQRPAHTCLRRDGSDAQFTTTGQT